LLLLAINTTLINRPSRSVACNSNEVEVSSANARQGWEISPGGAACEVRKRWGNGNGNHIPL